MQNSHFRNEKTFNWAIFFLSFFHQTQTLANVIGSETQNFNPTTDGLGFVTVHASEVLPPGTLNLGLFVNHAINTLPIFEPSDVDEDDKGFRDSVTGTQLHASFGLFQNFSIGAFGPYIINQEIKTTGDNQGKFVKNGGTGVGINAKYKLWGDQSFGLATVLSSYYNYIQNNPYAGKNAGPTLNLEMVLDKKIQQHLVGINIGHRWRSPGEPIEEDGNPIRPINNQLIASVAGTYTLNSTQAIIAEIFSSSPTKKASDGSKRLESSVEGLMGYRHYFFDKQLALHGGGGTELIHGQSSPDWRVYIGVNFTPKNDPDKKPRKSKEDDSPEELGPVQDEETLSTNDILFPFNSSELILKGQNRFLFRLPKHLLKEPVYQKLVIIGNTDNVGGDEYNKKLSLKRAQSIRNWLIQNYKLDPNKIFAVGDGEDNPVATNKTEAGRQLNRRVEFKIYRKTK